MALTPGTRLGPYEILSALGVGGMGVVYRARDTKLNRDVALKVLPDSFALDPDRLARFRREAQVLASLNHSNIAQIYGFEDSGDTHALVMELVEGPTLAEMIAGGPPLHDALNIARQLAEALEAAHEQGIVHRDLKPANIKVRDDGTVKVLDFGLAKALEPASGSGLQASGGMTQSPTITSPAMMTGVGVILGTAAYMSPEQASGKAVDKRADIWAFGVVLFELVTGKRLFDGETIAHTLADVLRRDLDFSKLPSDIPIALRDLLYRCLDRNVKTRLRDMGEARIVLDYSIAHPETANLVNTGNPVNVANAGRPWRRVLPWAFASTTGIAAAVMLTLWAPWRQTTPLLPVRFTIVPPAAQPLLVTNTDREIAISPDGSLVAYIANGNAVGGVGQLMVRAIDRLEFEPLRGITGARAPFFSPDGKWIGYFAGVATAELRKVAVAGGPPIPLCRFIGNPRGASWGPNDTIVFATSDTTGLLSVSASGGEPKVLTTPDLAHGEQDHWFPSVLPNGNAVLFTVVASGVLGNLTTSANAANQHLAMLDLKSGLQKTLVRSGTQAEYLEPSMGSGESGLLVYAAAGSLLAVRFDPVALEVKSDPVPVVEQVATGGFGSANFGVTRTGTLIYVPGGQTTAGGGVTRPLVWVDRRGREESIDLPPRAYYAVRLSPDGKRLALDVRDQDNDIWIWDLSRQTLDRRTFDASVDRLPVWTPDGGRIAFASQRDGADSLYWRPSDGTGSDERLTTSEGRFHVPNSFSPDGKRLVFRDGTVAGNSGDGDLMMLLLDGKARPTPLVQTRFDERNGEVSPDGRWLAYESNESGQFQIYVRPFPEIASGRVQIGAGTKPAWRRDSRELFYVDANNFLTAVPVQAATTFAAGTAVKLFETRSSTTANGRFYDVSPDGQRFVVIKESPANQDTNATPASMVVVLNWFEELKTRVPTK